VTDKFGKLDILVNNAHASRMNTFEQTTKADLDLSFNTGFYPTFYLMQAALPYLKESEGKIINFASGAGIHRDANQASYAATKQQPECLKSNATQIQLRRLSEREVDIERAALFFASEDSEYITGQTIMVDSGATKLR